MILVAALRIIHLILKNNYNKYIDFIIYLSKDLECYKDKRYKRNATTKKENENF